MSDVKLDFGRPDRIGLEEAIFCQGKTVQHLATILSLATKERRSFLLTRLSADQYAGLQPEWGAALDYDTLSRTAVFGKTVALTGPARVALVAAGTSDAHVLREAERALAYAGEATTCILDVGVAGLWRLQERLEEIRRHPVVIAVAGMDAAMPTVLGGLLGNVLIGVPTSTGYGVATGGQAALHAMLSSCAPGVPVMNIDNGYGAACAALRVLRALDTAAKAVRHGGG